MSKMSYDFCKKYIVNYFFLIFSLNKIRLKKKYAKEKIITSHIKVHIPYSYKQKMKLHIFDDTRRSTFS